MHLERIGSLSKHEMVSDFLKISVYSGNHPPRHKKRVSLFCGHKDFGFNVDIKFRKYSMKNKKITDEKQLKYVFVI